MVRTSHPLYHCSSLTQIHDGFSYANGKRLLGYGILLRSELARAARTHYQRLQTTRRGRSLLGS